MKDVKQDRIRVFLVDDNPIVREGVRSYLTSRGVAVAGVASDAPEALRKVKKLKPDVIVLDVGLPSFDGGELAILLRRLVTKARIIAFSIHSSEEYVVRMARCGARGYVTKDQTTAELLGAIKQVFGGGLCFPAGFTKHATRQVLASLKESEKNDTARPYGLFPRRCNDARP